MFYKMKSDYILRGWEEMAWVLVKRPENQTRLLGQKTFQALLLCDGETDVDDLPEDSLKEVLRQCEADGIIEPSASPCPLEPDQYYRYYHNRYIRRVFWSVTGRCNFRCRHCYMDAPDAMLGELSTEEALDLIDQMAECGVLQVDITGGEPLVRKDLWQLIDRILFHKMVIRQMYTNGWLLDEKVLDAFERRGLKPEIEISFDGIGWHDWMRGIQGAEKAALRAMQLCRERNFPVSAAICIHKGNVATLPQTIEVLCAVGVTDVGTANVDETDLWRRHSEGNGLTWPEYVEAMLPYIDWYYEAGKPVDCLELGGVARLRKDAPAEVCVRQYDGTEDCLDAYLCGATRWSCYITPEGRLLPCMPMTASPEQNQFPKVQEIGLRAGLSGSSYMQFVNGRVRDLMEANAECASCDYRLVCGGGCRASALAGEDHCLMGCDRTMCMMWKDGYVERIRRAVDAANEKYGKGGAHGL